QHGTYRATDRMNIRRQPSLDGQTVGTLGIGQTVQYDSYIDANGYRWISYVGYSGNRNYIARRNFGTGSVYGLCY
ncbi:SH3 domain-containing protein, partial [Candidatus Saccharibacteria bacterium]|nr:SH3 domain-containing protein [Candidatus Saccharibacteria bacterium]